MLVKMHLPTYCASQGPFSQLEFTFFLLWSEVLKVVGF